MGASDFNPEKTYLGIEFGSTRIKAILIDERYNTVASGSHDWENRLDNGIWTYTLDDIWNGIQDCYKNLNEDVKAKYGSPLQKVGAIGISAMMHGYLAFDAGGKLLAPFRTWRNTNARQASAELTKLFDFNIPERWSISQLYQSILDNEAHVKDVALLTSLAGYVHWKLTGQKVLGIGDAAGVVSIDSSTKNYTKAHLDKFSSLIAPKGYPWKIEQLLPKVLLAGDDAGTLTAEGAKLLDPSGQLQPGIVFCPPEGDAGTGMVATNSVAKTTGNVSAGTSIFAMIVLEQNLARLHREIDNVTTPDGSAVAMVHANNCTSDLNAWVKLFEEFAELTSHHISNDELYGSLYRHALKGDPDCGGLVSYGYFSGEFITGVEEGRPMFVRLPDAKFSLANFMQSHLYSSLAVIKIGMDILTEDEKVRITRLLGHGGLFKTKGVGQQIMANAMNTPVTVMDTAGEGGAWGIAVLAAYTAQKPGTDLTAFLKDRVFAGASGSTLDPQPEGVAGFNQYMKNYRTGLELEANAARCVKEKP